MQTHNRHLSKNSFNTSARLSDFLLKSFLSKKGLEAQFQMTRFTTVPLKALAGRAWIRYLCLLFWKLLIYDCGVSKEVTCTILLQEHTLKTGDITWNYAYGPPSIQIKHIS